MNSVGFFFGAGQATQSGFGLLPLSWSDIRDYREENEIDMTLWERDILKRMSDAYCSEYHRSTSDPDRPAPYKPEVVEEEVDHLAKARGMLETLRRMKARKEQ